MDETISRGKAVKNDVFGLPEKLILLKPESRCSPFLLLLNCPAGIRRYLRPVPGDGSRLSLHPSPHDIFFRNKHVHGSETERRNSEDVGVVK